MSRIPAKSSLGREPLLFVYGTLRPFYDIPLAHWLRAHAEHLGEARSRGRLYDLGPYPGFVAACRRDDWVRGDVYRLRRLSPILRVLDRYEAGPAGTVRPRFERAAGIVHLRAERKVAWLYLYRRRVSACRRIVGGDYRVHCDAASFSKLESAVS